MPKLRLILFLLVILINAGCRDQKQQKIPQSDTTAVIPEMKRVDITYNLVSPKDSIKKVLGKLDSAQKSIVLALNRVDAKNISRLDTIVLPTNLKEAFIQYMPYPAEVAYLGKIHKIIFFSYAAQAYGAYENGKLIYTGPTSMGRQNKQTPTGLFYANWKAEKTNSTVNDEWELKWNFNIENDSGIGWHQYALPGYPASHSCLRLFEKDAKNLYAWADEWILKGADSILANGTPTVVFGSYPFGNSRPWYGLGSNPKVLDISAKDLEQLVTPHLAEIMAQQEKRIKLEKEMEQKKLPFK